MYAKFAEVGGSWQKSAEVLAEALEMLAKVSGLAISRLAKVKATRGLKVSQLTRKVSGLPISGLRKN